MGCVCLPYCVASYTRRYYLQSSIVESRIRMSNAIYMGRGIILSATGAAWGGFDIFARAGACSLFLCPVSLIMPCAWPCFAPGLPLLFRCFACALPLPWSLPACPLSYLTRCPVWPLIILFATDMPLYVNSKDSLQYINNVLGFCCDPLVFLFFCDIIR